MKMLHFLKKKSRKPKRNKRSKIKKIVKKHQLLLRLFRIRLPNPIELHMIMMKIGLWLDYRLLLNLLDNIHYVPRLNKLDGVPENRRGIIIPKLEMVLLSYLLLNHLPVDYLRFRQGQGQRWLEFNRDRLRLWFMLSMSLITSMIQKMIVRMERLLKMLLSV
jgi:hypothetical protein